LNRSTCPIPEVAKLGQTLRQWRTEILAYFGTGGVSNGGTEAINGVIEKTRRLAHGFRNFTNYRILLAADGTRPYRRPPTKSRSADEPTQADLRRADILAVHRLVALSRAAR
jgi:hypothetical protein